MYEEKEIWVIIFNSFYVITYFLAIRLYLKAIKIEDIMCYFYLNLKFNL